METKTQPQRTTAFAKDVKDGLNHEPKRIPSKYFYDEKGSKIFEEIMQLKEYYPTKCEYEILETQKHEILEAFSEGVESFNIVELGAGNGYKTKVLIDYFYKQKVNFSYTPLDISDETLEILSQDLNTTYPNLEVKPIAGDYFKHLSNLPNQGKQRNVILFMGANIGNYNHKDSISFFRTIASGMSSDDLLFTGFDLKKDPRIILRAYNDPYNVTRAFNLNLLNRMNVELGANFDLNTFDHYPTYDPSTGEAKSFLVSKEDQDIYFEELDLTIHFNQWEEIHTEISRKYSLHDIERLASEAGYINVKNFIDCKKYFTDSLWKIID